ncbi:MAG: hypothetical protein JRG73_11240 [Deltaproteobacteria bacterium]|nr:hypothetical protein [Deltaproteobacteria bacterium]
MQQEACIRDDSRRTITDAPVSEESFPGAVSVIGRSPEAEISGACPMERILSESTYSSYSSQAESSGRASVRAYKIGNEVKIWHHDPDEYMVRPLFHDVLTGADAIKYHAAGASDWVPATWRCGTVRPLRNVKILETFYRFINPEEVTNFLLAHDHLVESLQKTHRHIVRIFAENLVETTLEHVVDPEEDFESLFVVIKTNLAPEEALEHLNRLDEEWWLDLPFDFRKIVGLSEEAV